MITEVTGFLQQTDRIVWGPWLIFLLLGCGVSDDKSVLSSSEKSVGSTWAGVSS